MLVATGFARIIDLSFLARRARGGRRKYLEQTHAFYERYGAKTILFARYLPIIRTFAPLEKSDQGQVDS